MIHHDNTCNVHCTDNDKTVEAEVMHFRPQDGLTVILATNKIVMKYKSKADIYVGNLMGMEFTSKGPKYYETKQGRF
jgi:hypothetical protein